MKDPVKNQDLVTRPAHRSGRQSADHPHQCWAWNLDSEKSDLMNKLVMTDLLSQQKPDHLTAATLWIRLRNYAPGKDLSPELLFDLVQAAVPDISAFDKIDHIL